MKYILLTIIVIAASSCGAVQNSQQTTENEASPTVGTTASTLLTSPAGEWEMTVNSPRGTRTSILTITDSNGELTGRNDSGTFKITAKGNILSWTSSMDTPMGSMEANYSATVEGDAMTGIMEMTSGGMAGRKMEFEGKKK